MNKKICSCNCHKAIMHEPICEKTTKGKKAVCTCNNPHINKTGLCSDCYANHKGHKDYKTGKFAAELVGKLI